MLWKNKLQHAFGDRLKFDYSLQTKSSLKTGGKCECFLEVNNEKEIISIFELAEDEGFDVSILGRGSNILIFDGLIKGIVIQAFSSQDDFEIKGEDVVFGSSVYLPRAIYIAHKHQLIGIEFAAGIPATIGGAVKMNAGTKLGEIADVLVGATLLSTKGVITKIKEELSFSYRYSNIADNFFIYKVRLKLKKASIKELKEAKVKLKEYLSYRNKTQPLNKPNLGSTFVNPPGDSAARLIDICNLKSFKIGGIQVSRHHANFIINDGTGTSADAIELIDYIIKTVKKKTGISLSPEIKMFGFK